MIVIILIPCHLESTLPRSYLSKIIDIRTKQNVQSSKSVVRDDQVLRGKNLTVEISPRLKELEEKVDQDQTFSVITRSRRSLRIKTSKSTLTQYWEENSELKGLVSGGGEEVEKY